MTNTSQNLNQKYSKSICEYLKNIVQNEEQLNQIATSITGCSLKEMLSFKEKRLKRLIQIKERLYYKSCLFIRMRKWRLGALRVAINSFRTTDNNWSNKTTIISSRTKKEYEDLKECTFQPAVNTSTSTRNSRYKINNSILIDRSLNNSSVYTRLYTDYARMNLKKEIQRNETEIYLAQSASFSPKFLSTPKKFQSVASLSFNDRLQGFNNKKENNKERLLKDIEENYKKHYTFLPITNKRSISLVKSPRSNSHSKKKIEYDTYIKEKELKEKTSRPLDLKRIENLYLSYKQKKNAIRNIQAEADKENGFTYQPIITNLNCSSDNYKKKIEKNVIERNEEFIRNKKEYINQAEGEYYYNQKIKISYTPEEKKQITQNIIDRLYANGLQKTLQRNNIIQRQVSTDIRNPITTIPEISDNNVNAIIDSTTADNPMIQSEEYSDKIISVNHYHNKKIITDGNEYGGRKYSD